MKRLLIEATIASLIAIPAFSQQAPDVTEVETQSPNQILFVGNSYLYYGDSIHNHVVRMARNAHPDETFTFKSATISGAYLDQHEISSYLEEGRLGLEEPFDLVVLQGHSTATMTPEKLDRFSQAVARMAPQIEETGAQVSLYMTPAYTEANDDYDPEMFTGIDDGYTSAGNDQSALVIPVGLAFEMAYDRRPEIELHKDFDGSHPTLLGTYLAAATVYAALYEPSAVGNEYDYYGAVPAEDAAFLQQVAEDAVSAYYGR